MARREETTSPWMAIPVAPGAGRLRGALTCDTVVVGSGMAGLSAAYELAAAGHRVVVIDRGPIAGGMTARTTAHLAPICDNGLDTLVRIRGEEAARLFQQSQEAAVDRIETIVAELAIECAFRRLDGWLFPASGMTEADAGKIRDAEYAAARKVGAAVQKDAVVPLPGFENAPVLRYSRQATFHPLAYLAALARTIQEKGGALFANSPVVKVEEDTEQARGRVLVTTEDGATVIADQAVVATNAPINDRVALHSKMAPYRTYAMAFALPKGTLIDALYWDMDDPYHYVRLQPGSGGFDQLIVGGADHKGGESDDGDVRFAALTDWISRLVPRIGRELHRWSGQVLETIDHCAFIGLNPGNSKIYVSCGDSGQGITHGAVAGLLLRDLIAHGSSAWKDLYEPSRKTAAGVFNYVSENMTAVKNFAEYVLPGQIDDPDALEPGQGGVLRDGMSLVAACRDKHGVLHLRSAACTHLGCVVHWNSLEQCWDCPCHGSHFAPDGTVLNGPATAPLAPADEGAKVRADTPSAVPSGEGA